MDIADETRKEWETMMKETTIDSKPVSESYTIKAAIVLPPDTNHHGTIFGGKLMAYIDDVATIAATRHARRPVVTASTDSVDFLHPVKKGDAICLSAFVTWTHRTSMEIFVRAITEDLLTGERTVCATSFLTFVALDEPGKPIHVPGVVPQTEEEKLLYDTAWERKEARKIRREESKKFARYLGVDYKLGGSPAAAPRRAEPSAFAGPTGWSAEEAAAAEEAAPRAATTSAVNARTAVVEAFAPETRTSESYASGKRVRTSADRAYASMWEDWS
jgi:acyl-CoA hydrolase